MLDFFTFPVDNLNGLEQGQDSTRAPQSYYEANSAYLESGDIHKPASGFHSPPVPSTESHMPGLASASGPSIASASSSAIGSPYSNTPQGLHENWVDTNNGLGLPGAVVGELLPNDYMGNTMDPDAFYQKKCTDSFVGNSPLPFFWFNSRLEIPSEGQGHYANDRQPRPIINPADFSTS